MRSDNQYRYNDGVITPLARWLARLSDTDVFIKEFERNLPAAKSMKDAYLKTEAQHYRLFEKPKYSSFKSFERVYYRRKKRSEGSGRE